MMHVSIVAALSSFALMLAMPAAAEASDQELGDVNAPLESIRIRAPYVFASNGKALFRASIASKRWQRLEASSTMPAGGAFADRRGDPPLIGYFANRLPKARKNEKKARYGLYTSRDDGLSWKIVLERDDISDVFLNSENEYFAVVAHRINDRNAILRSLDSGKSWQDITGNLNCEILMIGPDPDRTSLVQIVTRASNNPAEKLTVYAAYDSTYRWYMAPCSAVGELWKHDSGISLLHDRIYRPTLANYFEHDFGESLQISAFEIAPSSTQYEFPRNAPVVIPIRVLFHFDGAGERAYARAHPDDAGSNLHPRVPRIMLADDSAGKMFWGLVIQKPDGDKTVINPQGEQEKADADESVLSGRRSPPSKRESSGPSSRGSVIENRRINLSPDSPYSRELDLRTVYPFLGPGAYRIHVIYNSRWRTNVPPDEFDGTISSPEFVVKIRK